MPTHGCPDLRFDLFVCFSANVVLNTPPKGLENLAGGDTLLGGPISAFLGQLGAKTAILHCIAEQEYPRLCPPPNARNLPPRGAKNRPFPLMFSHTKLAIFGKTGSKTRRWSPEIGQKCQKIMKF